jgi:hypothetical protein
MYHLMMGSWSAQQFDPTSAVALVPPVVATGARAAIWAVPSPSREIEDGEEEEAKGDGIIEDPIAMPQQLG